MRWLQNFMRGRHGLDSFCFFLIIISIILSLLASLSSVPYLGFISLILILWCWQRMLSRNHYKRMKENNKYLKIISPIKYKYHELKNHKTYKYYHCPSCKKRLRVPKGKGSISITCPHCKNKFDKRT